VHFVELLIHTRVNIYSNRMLNFSIQLLMCEYFIPISSMFTINRLNFVVTCYDTLCKNFANLCFEGVFYIFLKYTFIYESNFELITRGDMIRELV
jgi:hypothetical protein